MDRRIWDMDEERMNGDYDCIRDMREIEEREIERIERENREMSVKREGREGRKGEVERRVNERKKEGVR